jgi:Putative restriction endonuclease
VVVATPSAPDFPGEFGPVDGPVPISGDDARQEVIDGVRSVTPVPFAQHQVAVTGMMYALRLACPAEFTVIATPLEYRPELRSSVRPDLMVVRSSDLQSDGPLTATPLLVVEVVSHETRHRDFVSKFHLYQRVAVPAYWLFDPATPSLEVFDLIDRQYQRRFTLVGDQVSEIEWPYQIFICPEEVAAG